MITCPIKDIESKQGIQVVRKPEAKDAAYMVSSTARAPKIKKDAELPTREPNIGIDEDKIDSDWR